MASGLESSTRVRLLIIFGLFIGLIIGLIAYEVSVYIKAKQQRENFESLRKVETKFLKTGRDKGDTKQTTAAQSDSTSAVD